MYVISFFQERKISPKSKFWGRISCGRPRGYPGRRPGAKTSVKHSKSWKKQAFRCGRPWPEGADVHDPRGVQKNFGQKNFGLNFRSLFLSKNRLPKMQLEICPEASPRFSRGHSQDLGYSFQSQRALPRGKNWLPTVSRQFLTRNYPYPNCLFNASQIASPPQERGFFLLSKLPPWWG